MSEQQNEAHKVPDEVRLRKLAERAEVFEKLGVKKGPSRNGSNIYITLHGKNKS